MRILIKTAFRALLVILLCGIGLVNITSAQSQKRDVEVITRGTLTPGIKQNLVSAIKDSITNTDEDFFDGTEFLVGSLTDFGHKKLVFVSSLDGEGVNSEFLGEGKTGKLLALRKVKNQWEGTFEGQEGFNAEANRLNGNIDKVSIDRFVAASNILRDEKLVVPHSKTTKAAQTENYKFPWAKDEAWELSRPSAPWHSNCESKDVCALDFFFKSNNKEVLAAADGSIVVMCQDQEKKTVNIRITDDGGLRTDYFHIKKGTQDIKTGDSVVQGQVLGEVWTGNLSNDCEGGFAQQHSNSGHLHWVLPQTEMIIDGWSFEYPDICMTKGDNEKCAKDRPKFWSTNKEVEVEDDPCKVPDEGDWVINQQNCIINNNHSLNGSLIVNDGFKLILQNSTLDVDWQKYKVLIKKGGTLLLQGNST